MSEAHTINIFVINCVASVIKIATKCIGGVVLIPNDLSAHSGILDCIERECDGHTSTPGPWSATCHLW